jgi:sirohydrochlorin cobaltochelatase
LHNKGVILKTIIVLAMHGVPPKDFPKNELTELFSLHARLEHNQGAEQETLARRYYELDAKMCTWNRTSQNDPFWTASLELAGYLSQATKCEVIVGFNEFCAPSLDDALDQAAAKGAEKIIVVTPMMTQGGEHSEKDIPSAIKRAQERHPKIKIIYAWPFPTSEVAQFLANQIAEAL